MESETSFHELAVLEYPVSETTPTEVSETITTEVKDTTTTKVKGTSTAREVKGRADSLTGAYAVELVAVQRGETDRQKKRREAKNRRIVADAEYQRDMHLGYSRLTSSDMAHIVRVVSRVVGGYAATRIGDTKDTSAARGGFAGIAVADVVAHVVDTMSVRLQRNLDSHGMTIRERWTTDSKWRYGTVRLIAVWYAAESSTGGGSRPRVQVVSADESARVAILWPTDTDMMIITDADGKTSRRPLNDQETKTYDGTLKPSRVERSPKYSPMLDGHGMAPALGADGHGLGQVPDTPHANAPSLRGVPFTFYLQKVVLESRTQLANDADNALGVDVVGVVSIDDIMRAYRIVSDRLGAIANWDDNAPRAATYLHRVPWSDVVKVIGSEVDPETLASAVVRMVALAHSERLDAIADGATITRCCASHRATD